MISQLCDTDACWIILSSRVTVISQMRFLTMLLSRCFESYLLLFLL